MSRLIFKEHHSQLDRSVNFESTFEDHTGRIEARFVQRSDEYFIIYLSSQTGCKQACRMCHLTATGQTDLRDVTVEEYLEQATTVFKHYRDNVLKTGKIAKMVHFNFMSRGEPFANKIFLERADEILGGLAYLAKQFELDYKFLISTIFPVEMEGMELHEIFKDPTLYPELYYSIYSTNKEFRRRWLPKALPVHKAFARLMLWQHMTGKKPKIHYAFIRNENDNLADVKAICDLLEHYSLDVNWNVVRYNPPNDKSQESIEGQINYLAGYIRRRLSPDARVKVIPRVGLDVMASCGTFLN